MHVLKLPYISRHISLLPSPEQADFINRFCDFYERGDGRRLFREITAMLSNYTEPELLGFSFNRASLKSFARLIAVECESRDYHLPQIMLRHATHGIASSYVPDVMDDASTGYDFDECRDYLDDTVGVFTCDDCERVFHNNDYCCVAGDRSVCESCRDDHYTYCDEDDEYVHNDDVSEAISRYGNRIYINTNRDNYDYSYDEDREIYIHNDWVGDSVIGQYHSSKNQFVMRHDDWTAKHYRHIGVDLEVEEVDGDTRNREAIAKSINEAVNGDEKNLFFERDGSLTCGFEMISNPMSLPALRNLFQFLNSHLVKDLRSHKTTTCGLHVHVSRSNLTPLQIQKVVAFINAPENEWFIRGLARRYGAGFCAIRDKKIGKGIHVGTDRYEAVNLTNRRTIEFRIFKGSLKYEAVIAAIEFCHAILEFCRPAVTGINQLSAGAFLSFCANKMPADTKVLRAYISSRLSGRAELLDQEAA